MRSQPIARLPRPAAVLIRSRLACVCVYVPAPKIRETIIILFLNASRRYCFRERPSLFSCVCYARMVLYKVYILLRYMRSYIYYVESLGGFCNRNIIQKYTNDSFVLIYLFFSSITSRRCTIIMRLCYIYVLLLQRSGNFNVNIFK